MVKFMSGDLVGRGRTLKKGSLLRGSSGHHRKIIRTPEGYDAGRIPDGRLKTGRSVNKMVAELTVHE